MKYKQLGSTDLKVTTVCLGTMTWGRQNTQAEAFEQMDYAFEYGINFWDTAELYAVPARENTYGKTEVIIGNWFAENPSKRAQVILASKIAGRGLKYIREGKPYTAADIMPSIEASLQRLQTDYIDLYQLHWPNRPHPNFGRHGINKFDVSKTTLEQEEEAIFNILRTLDDAIKAGKIRHYGLSNETPWGISKYIEIAKKHNLPKVASVQNEFSLIMNKDWPYVAETCILEEVGYLPWSPLGAGVLSGKYRNDQRPEGSRWTLVNRHGNFRDTENVHKAVEAYIQVADKYQLTPAQLALAWCHQFDWVTSTIIGATSMPQLKENIAAFEVELSQEALKEINAIHKQFPMPY